MAKLKLKGLLLKGVHTLLVRHLPKRLRLKERVLNVDLEIRWGGGAVIQTVRSGGVGGLPKTFLREEPLGTMSYQTSSKRSLPFWLLIGARKHKFSGANRELKIETFSGRWRLDWQSEPGTEVAVASLQNSNIKIAVNSGGRRLGRLPKRKIWLHIKN